MPFIVGTDEAGYGPNLGPLTISAALWWVDADPCAIDLYAALAGAVVAAPGSREPRIAIADSKTLYKSGSGLRLLERGLLPTLATAGQLFSDWHEAWQTLEADRAGHRHLLPWHADYELNLPLELPREELAELTERLQACLAAAGVRLVALQTRAIFPEQFNGFVDEHGNKGAALSHLTLELLAEMLDGTDGEPVLVVCDKHGGRNHYRQLLQHIFPDSLVEVYAEGPEMSVYRWGPPAARVEVRFQTRAENFLPAALASMASKYLRELSMRAFNDYWCERVADLRPTAGYPVDALRFKADIAAMQTALGIDDRVLWRNR